MFELSIPIHVNISHECKGILDFHSSMSNSKAYLSQFPNSLVSSFKYQLNHVAHSPTRTSSFYEIYIEILQCKSKADAVDTLCNIERVKHNK